MADETEYRIPVTADVSDLVSKFQQAGDSAREMGEKMSEAGNKGKEGGEKIAEGAEKGSEKLKELKEGVDKNLEAVDKMMGGWEGLLGILGAGAAAEVLSKIAETTIELGNNISMTAAMLTVGADEARAFNEMCAQMGVDASAAAMMIRRLEMDAASGGKQLNRLGIDIHDVNGHLKSGLELFWDTIEAVRNLSDKNQQSAAMYDLAGKSGMQLLAVINQLKPAYDDAKEEAEKMGGANQRTADNATALTKELAKVKSAWEDGITNQAPLVMAALQSVEIVIKEVIALLEVLEAMVRATFNQVGSLLAVSGDLIAVGKAPWFTPEFGQSIDKLKSDWTRGTQDTQKFSDDVLKIIGDMQPQVDLLVGKILKELSEWKIEPPKAEPPPKGGGEFKDIPKKEPKGPAPLDTEQMDNALEKTQQLMDNMANATAKLGSEAQMASKASADSYGDLAAKAQADFEVVKQRYAAMTEAIESGSRKAATEATNSWHNAVEKWKTDFDAAKARAEADFKEIKSYADQMASEVSGILNSAITGKLNWAQELDKVLAKMIDELTRYVFEMVGLMIRGETMSQAAQTAGQNNMVGELIGWVAKMLGVKTAGNTADTTQQVGHETAITTAKATAQATQAGILEAGQAAQQGILKANAVVQGTTQAGVAAANTMAALTPIPYVGPAIAAATAPTIFSETMAYAVAEAGFDVPPGLKPLTQLHPREMVLPESLATGVRNMTSGSGSGVPGAGVNQTFNLQAWDGQSVVDMLLGNGGAIAGAMAGALRSGMVLNTGG